MFILRRRLQTTLLNINPTRLDTSINWKLATSIIHFIIIVLFPKQVTLRQFKSNYTTSSITNQTTQHHLLQSSYFKYIWLHVALILQSSIVLKIRQTPKHVNPKIVEIFNHSSTSDFLWSFTIFKFLSSSTSSSINLKNYHLYQIDFHSFYHPHNFFHNWDL